MATARQFVHLLVLLLRLKSWRLVLAAVTVACLLANLYLFAAVDSLATQSSEAYLGLTRLNAKEFASGSSVVVDDGGTKGSELMSAIVRGRGGADGWSRDCSGRGDCDKNFFYHLQSDLGSGLVASAAFNDSRYSKPSLECRASSGAALKCAYLLQLMLQAQAAEVSSSLVFKDAEMMQLISQENLAPDAGPDGGSSDGDTACQKRSYPLLFPFVVMLHMILAITGLLLYIIVVSLPCISSLKESGFLQLMVHNGLSVSAYWGAVWCISLLELLVFSGVLTLSFHLQCPGHYGSDRLVLVFFSFLMCSVLLMALAYLCTVLIKSYFLSVLLMILVNVLALVMILLCRLLFATNPDTRLARDISLLLPFGHIAEFVTFVLMSKNAVTGYQLAIFVVTSLMGLGTIVLSVYLDFIVANGNGLQLPLSFPLRPQFWRSSCAIQDIHMHPMKQQQQQQQQQQQPNVEPVPETLSPAIRVDGISKTYSSRRFICGQLTTVNALNQVSCTIYADQITALIGHNGAGKTTLIKVLVGDESPSGGGASVSGCRMTDPLERLRLRGSIGICEQTDVLSSSLTVMQCIQLALVSRGFSPNHQAAEVSDLLSRLDLADKRDVKATELSGGQKRKLCTILSLVGNPKVVFLDEPTSGLDPVSRRRLWQILQEQKVGRSVILCTQFMDEADLLADRKIFLSGGSLICAGSSLFLKHAFGCGVIFNVSLKDASMSDDLLKLMRKVCSSVQVKSEFKTELELQVPLSDSSKVPDLLRVLESRSDLVDAFGLSQATLDEIFMRMKDVDVTTITQVFQSGQLSSLVQHNTQEGQTDNGEFEQLFTSQTAEAAQPRLQKQFAALVGMNLLRLRRAKLKLCCRFIFPAILLLALGGAIYLENLVGSSSFPVRQNVPLSHVYITRGVCVSEKDDPNKLNRRRCARLFTLAPSYVSVVEKNSTKSLSHFLVTSKALEAFNRTCIDDCVFVYASSWNPLPSMNSNRSVASGVFRRYRGYSEIFYDISLQFMPFILLSKYFGVSLEALGVPMTYASTFVEYTGAFFPLTASIVLTLLLSIIPVTYISDPVEDKESRVRYYLESMGMRQLSYWLNTFLLHWVQYAVFVVIAVILFVSLLSSRYANAYFVCGVCMPVLVLGTTSNQLMVYSVGTLLKKPNPIVTVVYFFFVLLMSLSVQAVQLSNVAGLVMTWCVPPFAAVALLAYGVKLAAYAMAFYNVDSVTQVPDLAGMYVTHPFILQPLIATIVHSLLLAAFVAARENSSFIAGRCSAACRRQATEEEVGAAAAGSDVGVEQEAKRIGRAARSSDNVLEVRRLQKTYPNGAKAVRGVTFGAVAGEIFGLLGPNGAGKTTTLSIVVGEEFASDGACEVRFRDRWMEGGYGAACGAVGYCPQHNPLFDDVTVREHAEFYSKIRGVPASVAKGQIENLLRGLALQQHAAKRASQLSGGNKRRLCLAVSLLGNPSVVVIDEASTGVDPEAKRFIWSAIRAMLHDSRAVVVTTHSMEEVEALCSRVGIMNKGVLIGFGSIQQLRSRYGHAYSLDVLVDLGPDEDNAALLEKTQQLCSSVLSQFPNSRVVEQLHSRIQFLVPQESITKLSDCVQWLADSQQRLSIRYFSFYQMSLDQVFVRLVKEHEEGKAEENLGFGAETA